MKVHCCALLTSSPRRERLQSDTPKLLPCRHLCERHTGIEEQEGFGSANALFPVTKEAATNKSNDLQILHLCPLYDVSLRQAERPLASPILTPSILPL